MSSFSNVDLDLALGHVCVPHLLSYVAKLVRRLNLTKVQALAQCTIVQPRAWLMCLSELRLLAVFLDRDWALDSTSKR